MGVINDQCGDYGRSIETIRGSMVDHAGPWKTKGDHGGPYKTIGGHMAYQKVLGFEEFQSELSVREL